MGWLYTDIQKEKWRETAKGALLVSNNCVIQFERQLYYGNKLEQDRGARFRHANTVKSTSVITRHKAVGASHRARNKTKRPI
jgi:hypothetical protein